MKKFAQHFTPPKIQLPKARPGDPRIGELLGTRQKNTPRLALIGFPCDQGVLRNGGRLGAALAPDQIREALFRMTPDAEFPQQFTTLLEESADLGNLSLSGRLEDDQELLGSVVCELLKEGGVPVILGGGHETAFGHFLGYAKAGLNAHVINIDSHPDVREISSAGAHSGSAFRQALEHSSKRCTSYSVYGLAPHSCAAQHREYLEQNRCAYLWRDGVSTQELSKIFGSLKCPCMCSFDIDALDQAHAPGASAPAAFGLSIDTWLHAFELAGATAQVRSVDLCEVNPNFDTDERTARVAALSMWHFMKGLARRQQGQSKPRLGFR
ncbi:MAG: formimidoylglutamase [Oligoflexia bacterium]|nr:formimidoylglutamase [Oligoflexia bacterium]